VTPGSGRAPVVPPLDYQAAGVDIDAADDAKHRIRKLVEATGSSATRGSFGGFGGLFRMPPSGQPTVLVASADGVGTKVKVAIEAGRHDTIGHDLVNHCVNDILAQGAVPMFFLDYVAFGKLEPAVVEAVVSGVASGCAENGCALLGGETAEMPGVYTPPDYDLAGFIVGSVSETQLLGPDRVQAGDVVVGLASSGLHTNGYALARRVVAERLRLSAKDLFPGTSVTVADVLLRVHRSYLRALRPVLGEIHAMAHITGGGLPGNVPRALPPSMDAELDASSWTVPHEFAVLAESGGISRPDMLRAFNMGVGMAVIAPSESSAAIIGSAQKAGIDAWVLGRVVPGSGRVVIE
jgi:phosphoribosylformylglycinamidine cyclo-ligase